MVEKTHSGGLWPSLYDPFRSFGARLAEWIAPPSEASASQSAYRIAIELPGVLEADIHLSVENGVATVRGEKISVKEEEGEDWFFCERQFGSFSRSFRLPPDADETGVKAVLKDGVLTITLPRREVGSAGRQVPIDRG
ncbi:Hsp20/alpha crystallin family protein [Thioclava sp. BHET1]|nr:Hsp20/alpha crystallin family protein [Thioclava sp. BHET1]